MPLSLLIAVAVAAGMAAGVFLDPSFTPVVPWVIVAAGGTAIAAASAGWPRTLRATAGLALAGAMSLVGAGAQDRAWHPPVRTLLEQRIGGFDIDGVDAARPDAPILVEARLLADAWPTDVGAAMRVEVARVWLGPTPERAPGGVSISVGGALAAERLGDWRAGRVIRAPVLLRRPARYLDAGVPDEERLLARRGIALVGTVKSAALVEVVSRGGWIDEWAGAARAAVRASLRRHVGARDPQSGAIATAILIGDRGALDEDVERRLQEAGTYHVIAISGGNIAILAGLVLGILWWLGARGPAAAGVAIAVLAAYAFIAGGGASVLRATLMAAAYLGLRVIDQRTSPVHAMALTAAALLVISPLVITDVGFWLTFGATAAIVIGATRTALPAAPWLRAPAALVAASAAAETALLPVGALVFQRVTVAGLLLNLAAVPCMGVVQVAAMVTVGADLAGAPVVARLAGWATHVSAVGLVASAGLVDLAPWTTWRVPSPSAPIVAAYYLALLLWVMNSLHHEGHEARNHEAPEDKPVVLRVLRGAFSRASWLRIPPLSAVGLLLWIALAPATLVRVHGDGRLHLTAMDVGQGDAFLVTFPNGRTLMIDSGGVSLTGNFDVGDRVLGPALRARGIGRLDYLAVTHGDPDHIGGAVALARDFAPLEVWAGVPVAGHEPTARLRAAAERERAGWRTWQRGDRLEIGGVELRAHHPPPPDWERQQVRNDDSLVIEARVGRVSILLTGDIGREAEEALIPSLDLLPLVVLKSPHHGSGTSSSAEFIKAVRPAIVVISCGRGNPYGHPVPYVLDRYRDAGAEVFRTDQDGQTEIVTDGQALERADVHGGATLRDLKTSHEGHEGHEGRSAQWQ